MWKQLGVVIKARWLSILGCKEFMRYGPFNPPLFQDLFESVSTLKIHCKNPLKELQFFWNIKMWVNVIWQLTTCIGHFYMYILYTCTCIGLFNKFLNLTQKLEGRRITKSKGGCLAILNFNNSLIQTVKQLLLCVGFFKSSVNIWCRGLWWLYKLSHKREWNTQKYSASASHIHQSKGAIFSIFPRARMW